MRGLSINLFLAALIFLRIGFANEQPFNQDTLDISLVNPGLAFQIGRHVDEQIIDAVSASELNNWQSEFQLLFDSKRLSWNFSNSNLSIQLDSAWLRALFEIIVVRENRIFRFKKNCVYAQRKSEIEVLNKGNYDCGYKWLADHGMPVGRYKLQNDIRTVNERNISKLSIVDFRSPGSSNAFCSLLAPGWGMYRVSYDRRKTALATGMVFLPLIVSVLSECVSRSAYQKYMGGGYGEEYIGYYHHANSWHRVSLVSAGLTCGAYVTQFSWTLKLGIENKIEQRIVRRIVNSKKWYIEND